MAMVQEEPAQKCSNSSSGGDGGGGGVCSSRSSKKPKQKKVPQRGLGVAQLEKIRLEEQHKRENAFRAPNSVLSPNSMALQIGQQSSPGILLPNVSRPHLSSTPMSIPPSPSPPNLTSYVPMFDQSFYSSPIVPFSKPLSMDGVERVKSVLSIPGHSHRPKLWDGEYNLEGVENQRLNQNGIPFWPNKNMPIEPHSSVLPLPSAMQRLQQYQHPASSSMVNILSGISSSSSSSSARNCQIEPPSNQIYRDNDYTPLWPEELKMVGVKRPYPFSPEYPPVPSFNCKLLPGYASCTSRAIEPTSCGNGSIVNVESHNPPPVREATSSSNSQFESNSRSISRENGALSGDFLSLAPPVAASLPQIDHRYHHCSRNPPPVYPEASNQTTGEEMSKRTEANGWGQAHIFSFFPLAKVQNDAEESSKRSHKRDSNGVVDLNLKL